MIKENLRFNKLWKNVEINEEKHLEQHQKYKEE